LPRWEGKPLSAFRAQFGDRWISQSLVAVKYYLTDQQNSLAPYGFEPIGSWGTVTAYRNVNTLGLAALYETCIGRDDFAKYGPEQREALLTTAVVLDRCTGNLQRLDGSEVDTSLLVGRPIT